MLRCQAITLTWRSGGTVGVVGVDGTNLPIEFLDGSRSIVKVFPKTTASGVTAAMLREVRVLTVWPQYLYRMLYLAWRWRQCFVPATAPWDWFPLCNAGWEDVQLTWCPHLHLRPPPPRVMSSPNVISFSRP